MRIKSATFYTVTPALDVSLDGLRSARDMLRYDLAFVHLDDPRTIALVRFVDGPGLARPTIARWSSFGVAVTPCNDPTLTVARESFNDVRERTHWITFRHPIGTLGRDYSRLVSITLADVLAAKTFQNL